jgi:hypothetical protein
MPLEEQVQDNISAVKRKLSARAPGSSLQTQCVQALLLGIAYNIYRLWLFPFFRIRRMPTEPSHFKIWAAYAQLGA